nr:hypothetical protein [Tanacetum cinerariifolium]
IQVAQKKVKIAFEDVDSSSRVELIPSKIKPKETGIKYFLRCEIGTMMAPARQCKELKRARDSQWYHDKALLMQAKEKGAVLDAEAEAFLADVECTAPYDQPLALITTNLDVSYPLAQEMQQEEHLNSKVDSVLDDYMITYDEYQNDSGIEAVPTVVSADEADKQSMIAVLQRMHTEIAAYVR